MWDPYKVLAVSRSATADDIKNSFLSLAKKVHANQNPKAAALFSELHAAYEILGDEERRRAFDRGDTFDRGGIDAEDNPAPDAVANPIWAISGLTLSVSGLMVAVVILVAQPLVMGSIMPPVSMSTNSASEPRPFDHSVVDRESLHREWFQKPAIALGPESAGATAVSGTAADKALATSALTYGSAIQSAANSQRKHEPIELLIGRSEKLISQGYLEAARMLLLPAAEAGEARATLALGATYDPVMLAILRVRGLAADVSLARYWYEQASELGSREAERRLQLLSVAFAQPKGRVVWAPVRVAVSAAPPVSATSVPSISAQLARNDTSRKLPALLGVIY